MIVLVFCTGGIFFQEISEEVFPRPSSLLQKSSLVIIAKSEWESFISSPFAFFARLVPTFRFYENSAQEVHF